MKKILPVIILCVSGSCFSQTVRADDYKVYSPVVEQGEFSLESNINYSIDDRSQYNRYLSHVDGFEYGVTDWWKVEVSAEVEKEGSQSMRATHLKWENIFAPWKPGENWLDAGFYIEGEKALRNGDPDNIEAKILLEKSTGPFTHTVNLIAGHNFGPHPNPGLDMGLSWRSVYRLNDMIQPGFEYYSDMGKLNHIEEFSDQDNVAGPVIRGKIGALGYDAGVLERLSNAAHETTFKLNLEYEF